MEDIKIDIISPVVSLAGVIRTAILEAKHNKEHCAYIGKKVELTFDIVQKLQRMERDLSTEQKSINAVIRCFKNCHTFIITLSKQNAAERVFYSSNNKEKLQMLEKELDDCQKILHFAVSVSTKGLIEEETKTAASREIPARPRLALVGGTGGQAARPQAMLFAGPKGAAAANDDDLIIHGQKFSKKELLKAMKVLNGVLVEQGHPELVMDLDTNFDDGNDACGSASVDGLSPGRRKLLRHATEIILTPYLDALEADVKASLKLKRAQ